MAQWGAPSATAVSGGCVPAYGSKGAIDRRKQSVAGSVKGALLVHGESAVMQRKSAAARTSEGNNAESGTEITVALPSSCSCSSCSSRTRRCHLTLPVPHRPCEHENSLPSAGAAFHAAMAASGAASGGRKYQLVLWGATGFTGKVRIGATHLVR